jgi:hypothetical protein
MGTLISPSDKRNMSTAAKTIAEPRRERYPGEHAQPPAHEPSRVLELWVDVS